MTKIMNLIFNLIFEPPFKFIQENEEAHLVPLTILHIKQ